MPKELTFKEVYNFLKQDDTPLVEGADQLLGLAIVCSPVVFGTPALSALTLLRPKNELIKLGKNLLKKVTRKKDKDYLARVERMRMAYGLICYTAFFEALDNMLPNDLRKALDLKESEKTRLAECATKEMASQTEEDTEVLSERVEWGLLPFPHPVTPDEQSERLGRLYSNMAEGFVGFLDRLAVWEIRDAEMVAQAKRDLEKLPQRALTCFEGQYLELVRTYQDFSLWSRLHENKAIRSKLRALSDYHEKHTSFLVGSEKKIDIGFSELRAMVQARHHRKTNHRRRGYP
jgi:hypothetical protein